MHEQRHTDRSDRRPQDEGRPVARPLVTEPAPQPTALGAPTVGGAVAASAMAAPSRAGEPDVRDEETVAPADGAVEEQPRSGP